ncbi:MAG: hypothetical protein AMXMBFR7_00400 [Planctomycetota bacterium]
MLAMAASVTCLPAAAADPDPAVSLLLHKVAAERLEKDIHFRCEVTLDNGTGRDLAVRSNFSSVFDGLEVVVTDPKGKVLVQRGYTIHQSPFAPPGRVFPLKQGQTAGTLVFPIHDLPADARTLKVRLVGTLPGSGFERILSSETLEVTVTARDQ